MAWTRVVCGRLGIGLRYSKDIVYNNFIWPETSEDQKVKLSQLAQAILDARTENKSATLADLYDPLTMPPNLTKAHKTLDRYVDKLYGLPADAKDSDRVALLFTLYQQKTQ